MDRIRRWFFLAAGAVILSGCDPVTSSAAGTSAPSQTSSSVAAVATPSAAIAEDQSGTNPNRVNQLKDLKIVDVKAAGLTVHAWVMDNESKRQEGMMFLTSKDVKETQGMIFVFPNVQAARNSFWMHNCPLGLDIIYIDAKNRVVNVGDGKPENDDQVIANGEYKWVLEVRRGWSKRHGLKPGAKVAIPAGLGTSE